MEIVKKNNAVVFGLTSDHIFAVACVMMDIKKLSPQLVDEVVIIHDGISEKDKKLIQTILPTRFILYDFPIRSRRVLHSRSVLHFTKMVFTKFECLKLLDEYVNVVWMDYDIVIQSDISELFLPCIEGIKMMPSGRPVRQQLLQPVSAYDMNVSGVSAGLFVFQDNLKDYNEMYRFCYSMLEIYAEKLLMPEQAVFDFMIQEFALSPHKLDIHIYSPHPNDMLFARTAKIIHSYAQPKFWNGIHNAQWEINYEAWQQMGGSKYRTPTLKEILVRKFLKVISRLRS